MTRTYRFHFDINEHIRAAGVFLGRDPTERRGKWILAVVFPVVILLMWWWLRTASTYVSIATLDWIFPAIALFFPIFTFVAMPRIIRKQVRAAAQHDPALRGELSRTLGEDALETTGSDGSSGRIPWESLLSVTEDGEFVLFIVTPRTVVYIPKRVIPEAELMQLRSWLANRVIGKCQWIV